MIAKKRAYKVSIGLEKKDYYFTHRYEHTFVSWVKRDILRAELDDFIARDRHKTTMSFPRNFARDNRKVSRIMRFIRLRSTARLAHFRDIARPSRAFERPLSHAKTTNKRSDDLDDREKTL